MEVYVVESVDGVRYAAYTKKEDAEAHMETLVKRWGDCIKVIAEVIETEYIPS